MIWKKLSLHRSCEGSSFSSPTHYLQMQVPFSQGPSGDGEDNNETTLAHCSAIFRENAMDRCLQELKCLVLPVGDELKDDLSTS